MYCIVLYCIVLYCIVLYYSDLENFCGFYAIQNKKLLLLLLLLLLDLLFVIRTLRRVQNSVLFPSYSFQKSCQSRLELYCGNSLERRARVMHMGQYVCLFVAQNLLL